MPRKRAPCCEAPGTTRFVWRIISGRFRKTALRRSVRPRFHKRLHALARQRVGALVLGVAGMAFYPAPVHAVIRQGFLQALPEIHVLHRFLVGGLPTAALPLREPGRDAELEILAVGVDVHLDAFLERLQRLDRGHHLHAGVGGEWLAAADLLLSLG